MNIATLEKGMKDETENRSITKDPPFLSDYNLHRITSRFSIEKHVAKKYEAGLKKFAFLKGLPTKILIIGYFIGILLIGMISTNFISSLFNFTEQQTNQIGGGVFFIIIVAGASVWILKKIAKNRIDKLELSHSDAVYHNIANAIKSYQMGEYSNTRDFLESARNLLKYRDEEVFNPKTRVLFEVFMEELQSDEHETDIESDFPIVANVMLTELSNVFHIWELERARKGDAQKRASDENYRYRTMVSEYMNDKIRSPTIKRTWPYIIAFPIVLLIYVYVGAVIAQIIAIFYIGVVEKLHDPDSE